MKLHQAILTTLIVSLAACAGPQESAAPPKMEVTVMDFRSAQGAYVLAYTTDTELRTMFEDRLVSDLAARDIKAYASHLDQPDVSTMTRDNVLQAAKARKAMFVLVVEEVRHGQAGVVEEQNRISQQHPTLQAFYRNTQPADHEHDDDEQVFVEVSAFLIQGDVGKLYWSGTTWSVQADGQAGRIANISTNIANAIENARRRRELGLD